MFRPSARANHLSDYWNALNRGAPDDELARLAAHVEPSHLAAIRQAREADHPPLPDPAFARRLERILMNAAAHPSAEAIPLPRIRGQAGTPGRPASRRPFGLPRPDIGRYAIPALEITLIIALMLASIAGIWLITGRNDEPNVIVPPVATPTTEATPGWSHFKGDAARRGESNFGPVDQPVELWRVVADGGCDSVPAVVGDTVYAACSDGLLSAFDAATGAILWQYVAEPFGDGPTVVDGLAYVVGGSGTLYAVDTTTGAERWRYDAMPVRDAPAVAGGLAVVNTPDGFLLGIDAMTGEERWRTQVTTSGAASTPALFDGIAYVGSADGSFNAIDGASGSVVWSVETGGSSVGTAVVADGIAYAGPSVGDRTSALSAYDAETGELLWQRDEPIFSPAVSNGVGYAGSDDGTVYAFDTATGEELWRTQVGGIARPVVAAGDAVYVPSDGDQTIYALDAATGAERWQVAVDGGIGTQMAIVDGRMYVATRSGVIQAFGEDPASGSMPSLVASPEATPETLSAVTNPNTGQVLWRQAASSWDVFAAPDGTVWVMSPGGYDILDADGTFIETWLPEGIDPATAGELDFRSQVTWDSTGNIYVLAPPQRTIMKYDADRNLAGTFGEFGSGDGQFLRPNGVAVDSQGNVYVSDEGRNDVQKFAPDGTFLHTIGAPGTGPGQFSATNTVVVDAQDRLYVTEPFVGRVQQFSSDGEFLAVFDGSGTESGTIGIANDVAVDPAGNVYIVDSFGHRILVFTPDGQLAGILTDLDEGAFIGPDGIALGPDGVIYVADYEAASVMAIAWAPVGPVATPAIATDATPVAATSGQVALLWQTTGGPDPLFAPGSMAFDSAGNLWVVDAANNRFQIFSPDGEHLETWGTTGDDEGEFNFNYVLGDPLGSLGGIAFAPDGSFYVADSANYRVQQFAADHSFIRAWGEFGTGEGQFSAPIGVVVAPDGNVYVIDGRRNDAQVFGPNGRYLFTLGEQGSGPGQLNTVGYLAIDTDGYVYVADFGNERIQKFAADGSFIMAFGEFGSGEGQLYGPAGIAFDQQGNIYIAEVEGGRIQVFDRNGAFLLSWSAADDGQGALTAPIGVLVDAEGGVYVTDVVAGTVQKYAVTLSALPEATPIATPVT